MYIEMIIVDQVVKRFHLPDKYLENIQGFSEQQNFEAREKIIALHIGQIKSEYQNVFPKALLRFQLAFESKMNHPAFQLPEETVVPIPKAEKKQKLKKAV